MGNARRWLVAGLTVGAFAAPPSTAAGHPGNTDARGGHECHTNCAQYGLGQGEYHFHNSGNGGSGSTGSSSGGGTSVITQDDCDNRRIRRQGRTLSREECERLIGQRVNLANTGFEAWMFALGGGAFLLAGAGLRRWRPTGSRTA